MPVSTYDRIDASLQRLLTITAPTQSAQSGSLFYKASPAPVQASGNTLTGYASGLP